MDPLQQYGLDEERVRRELASLDWEGGLTTEEIRQQLPALPEDLFADLEDGASPTPPAIIAPSSERMSPTPFG